METGIILSFFNKIYRKKFKRGKYSKQAADSWRPLKEKTKMENNRFADYVAQTTAAGLFVVPLSGKLPILKYWQAADNVPADLWGRADSVGLRCGPCADGNQIVCVDFDTIDKETGEEKPGAFEVVADFNAELSRYYLDGLYYLERSAHGLHYIFKVDRSIPFTNEKVHYNEKADCLVETRGTGGQVRIYPSTGCEPISGDVLTFGVVSSSTVRSLLDYIKNERPLKPKPAAAVVKKTAPTLPTFAPAIPPDDTPAGNMRNNPRAVVDYLVSIGWKELPDDEKYYSLQRPGATGENNHSIHIAKEGGAVVSWSSNISVDSGDAVSPLSFIASELFEGDEQAAARMWRVAMMQPTRARTVDPCAFSEFAEFEPMEPTANKTPAHIVAPGNWETGLRAALQYGLTCGNAAYIAPESLFSGSPVLSLFVKAISPDNDERKRAVSFAAAFSALSFLSSRVIMARHLSYNHITGELGSTLQEGTASYNLTLAPSGTGKDCGRRFVADIVRRFGETANKQASDDDKEKRKRFYYSSIASAQSFAADFSTTGKALVSIDEAGDFLSLSTEQKTGAPYLRKFLSDLKEYRTNETAEYIDTEKSMINRNKGGDFVRIKRPALSAYFTGVEDKIKEIPADFVNDGTWGRFNVFYAHKGNDSVDLSNVNADALIALLQSAGNSVDFNLPLERSFSIADNWAEIGDDRIIVDYTPECWAELIRFEKIELVEGVASIKDDFPGLAAMLNQAPLKLWKTALTYAAARCTTVEEIKSLTVTTDDAKNAELFVLWQIVQLCRFLNLGYSVKKDETLKRFRRAAMQAADEDGSFTAYNIAEKSTIQIGLSYRQLKRYISELEKDGIIIAVGKRGRGFVYKFTDDSTRKGF